MEFLLGHVEPEVFPAPAGINRRNIYMIYIGHSVPRASGDKPTRIGGFERVAKCSPRQRG
ncbi:hypothetical protein CQ968_002066 [Escherichia coli]|nr:hypothetical protein [Escherichia coli]